MWLYLIHFETPLSHAQHYVGACGSLIDRLKQHHSGHGARLIDVIQEKEIEWKLARCWRTPDAFKLESILKRKIKGAAKYCPCCRPFPATLRKIDDFPIELLSFHPFPPFAERI